MAKTTPTGIRSVHTYTASPVETCDRCGAAIKYVTLVAYKDGTSQRYGSECINKILAGDTSLRRLFEKNRKLAEKYRRWAAVLSRPSEAMPRGQEYYGSGLYFIADDEGAEIVGNGRSVFHPLPDWDKNQSGDRYVQKVSPEAYRAAKEADVRQMREWLGAEAARAENFLARIISKGLVEEKAVAS